MLCWTGEPLGTGDMVCDVPEKDRTGRCCVGVSTVLDGRDGVPERLAFGDVLDGVAGLWTDAPSGTAGFTGLSILEGRGGGASLVEEPLTLLSMIGISLVVGEVRSMGIEAGRDGFVAWVSEAGVGTTTSSPSSSPFTSSLRSMDTLSVGIGGSTFSAAAS